MVHESHDIKIITSPSDKDQGIQLKGRAKVAQNMGTTMAEILDIIAYMIGWFKIE